MFKLEGKRVNMEREWMDEETRTHDVLLKSFGDEVAVEICGVESSVVWAKAAQVRTAWNSTLCDLDGKLTWSGFLLQALEIHLREPQPLLRRGLCLVLVALELLGVLELLVIFRLEAVLWLVELLVLVGPPLPLGLLGSSSATSSGASPATATAPVPTASASTSIATSPSSSAATGSTARVSARGRSAAAGCSASRV